MNTPPNEAGRLTEKIMFALLEANVLRDKEVATYNRAYSTVYEALSKESFSKTFYSGNLGRSWAAIGVTPPNKTK